MIILSDNTRGRDRPKLPLDTVIKIDMIELNLGEHLVLDRAQWRKMIHVADLNWVGLELRWFVMRGIRIVAIHISTFCMVLVNLSLKATGGGCFRNHIKLQFLVRIQSNCFS